MWCCYCADAGDGYYQAAIFFDADYGAFGSFKFAGYDAYPLSFTEFTQVVCEVLEVFVAGGGDDAKHSHFMIRNY